MTRAKFESAVWFTLLEKLVAEAPPDGLLATGIMDMVRDFVRGGETAPVPVWNFYKHVLDMMVHTGGGNGFMLRLFDLEPYYEAPLGSYQQADGSIKRAPWRRSET
jgi:hypothetical protein